MEADEAADRIREAAEGRRSGQRESEQFRTRTAMVVAFLAMLLAIASLGRENSSKETINSNIRASDSWAFFQAKNIRQTDYQLASDHLETILATGGTSLSLEVRKPSRTRSTVTRRPSLATRASQILSIPRTS